MIELARLWDTYSVDWPAISAVATLLAVLVALSPSWQERIKQKQLAINLRGRALISFMILKQAIVSLTENSVIAKTTLSEEEINALRSLELIMANAAALDPGEQDVFLFALAECIRLNALIQSYHPIATVIQQAKVAGEKLDIAINLFSSKPYGRIEAPTVF